MPVFETEKKFRKPTVSQREFHDVAKIATFGRVKITKRRKYIEIKTASILEYHYKNGGVEEAFDQTEVTARIPKTLVNKVIKELRRMK